MPESPLVATAVSRHFGGHKAVDEVSFELPDNTLMAVIGPNGAGKTTLFNLIAGAMPVTLGKVTYRGHTIQNAASACRAGIARTFQNVRLFHEMTVLENILCSLGGQSFWQGSLRLPRGMREDRLRMKRAYYLLEDAGVGDLAETPAEEIPFGQQRLVEIARALALNPSLLLLDEPAAGLNATETVALAALIQRIHQRGISILLVEHDMHLVMNIAQRVMVLDRGRKIADGTPAEVRANSAVKEAYLGTEAHA